MQAGPSNPPNARITEAGTVATPDTPPTSHQARENPEISHVESPHKAPTVRQPAPAAVLLPGMPFQGLVTDLVKRMLSELSGPQCIALRQVSKPSLACMDNYLQTDVSKEQLQQLDRARHCRGQRQMAASASLFNATWRAPDSQPSAADLARCQAMAGRATHLRVPLAHANCAHWKTMVEMASAGAWKRLELDVIPGHEDVHLMGLRELTGFIAGAGRPGSELVLRLQFVDLGDNQIRGLKRLLEEFPHFSVLCISSDQQSPAIDELAGAVATSSLKEFRCLATTVSFHGGNRLFDALGAPHLEVLEIDNISANRQHADGWVAALRSCSTLKHFSPGCVLHRSAFSSMVAALSNHPQLSLLDLSKCLLGPDAVEHLAQLIGSNGRLKTLKLDKSRMADRGMTALAQSLHADTTLQHLALRDRFSPSLSRPGTASMIELYEALAKNRTLLSLDLAITVFSQQDADALLQMLWKNATLQTLELNFDLEDGSSSEDDEEVRGRLETLMPALALHRSLKKLALRIEECFPRDALYAALRDNATWETLDLDNIIFNGNDVSDLADALSLNRTLTELTLSRGALCNNGSGGEGEADDLDGLCKLVSASTVLRRLHLIDCALRGDATLLAGAFAGNPRLSVVEIQGTMHFPSSDVALLMESILAIPTLSVLLIDEVDLPYAALDAMVEALKTRSTPLFLAIDPGDLNIDSYHRNINAPIDGGSGSELEGWEYFDLRRALLDVVAHNPHIVIPQLAGAFSTSEELDWRDFVLEYPLVKNE